MGGVIAIFFFIGIFSVFMKLVRYGQSADHRADANAGGVQYSAKKQSPPPHFIRFSEITFYKSSLKKFIPFGLFLLLPIGITIFFTHDPIAICLMIVASLLITAVVFYFINEEEHQLFMRRRANDLEVNESVDLIDNFIVPVEWTKKFL